MEVARCTRYACRRIVRDLARCSRHRHLRRPHPPCTKATDLAGHGVPTRVDHRGYCTSWRCRELRVRFGMTPFVLGVYETRSSTEVCPVRPSPKLQRACCDAALRMVARNVADQHPVPRPQIVAVVRQGYPVCRGKPDVSGRPRGRRPGHAVRVLDFTHSSSAARGTRTVFPPGILTTGIVPRCISL